MLDFTRSMLDFTRSMEVFLFCKMAWLSSLAEANGWSHFLYNFSQNPCIIYMYLSMPRLSKGLLVYKIRFYLSTNIDIRAFVSTLGVFCVRILCNLAVQLNLIKMTSNRKHDVLAPFSVFYRKMAIFHAALFFWILGNIISCYYTYVHVHSLFSATRFFLL